MTITVPTLPLGKLNLVTGYVKARLGSDTGCENGHFVFCKLSSMGTREQLFERKKLATGANQTSKQKHQRKKVPEKARKFSSRKMF